MIAGNSALAAGSAKASDGLKDHEAIVVGVGSAGLSATAALQKPRVETVVLENSDAVGARAASASVLGGVAWYVAAAVLVAVLVVFTQRRLAHGAVAGLG